MPIDPIVSAVILILVGAVLGGLAAWLAQAKPNGEFATALADAAAMAVEAAEQLYTVAVRQALDSAPPSDFRKAYAVGVLRDLLTSQRIKIPASVIDAAIEAAVRAMKAR